MVENMTIEELNGAKKCLGLLVAKFAEAFAEVCAEVYGCDDSGTPEEEPEATEEDAGEEAGDEDDAGAPAAPRRGRVTEAEVDEWVRLRDEGLDVTQIAKKAGRPFATVWRKMQEWDGNEASEPAGDEV